MNTWWTAVPTYGSLTVGIMLTVRAAIDWWPGLPTKGSKFDIRGAITSAAPFLLSYAYGMLIILGVGGLVGLMANATVWGVGWVGDGALVFGVGATRQSVGSATRVMALSNGGLMMVLIFGAVLLGIRAKYERARQPTTRGVLAGVLTGTVAGIANALAIPLASAVNAIGSFLPSGGAA